MVGLGAPLYPLPPPFPNLAAVREFDTIIAACDLPGIKKVLPESFRKIPTFDNIYELDCVPIATVQLRFDGWVTEMQARHPPRISRCSRWLAPPNPASA